MGKEDTATRNQQKQESETQPTTPKISLDDSDEDDSDDSDEENEEVVDIQDRQIQRIVKVRPPLTKTQQEASKWHKIRYYPTEMEKEDLRKVAGITRLIYNEVMGMIKTEQLPFEGEDVAEKEQAWRLEQQRRMESYNAKHETEYDDPQEFLQRPWYDKGCLKKYFITANASWVQQHPFTLFAARETRFGAIKDCLTGLKSARTNQRNGNIQGFEKKFRTLKNQRSNGFCLRLASNALNHYKVLGKTGVRLWPNNMKHWYLDQETGVKTHHVLRLAKESVARFPKKFTKEVKIHKDSYGDYYLIVNALPKKNAVCPETQGASAFHSRALNRRRPLRVFGIDPGKDIFFSETTFNECSFNFRISQATCYLHQ